MGSGLLAAASEAQDKVQRTLLLDVVVRERATVLQLLARENQTLLVRRNTLLVLNLLLDTLDRVGGVDVQGDGLAGKSLDEDLHVAHGRFLSKGRVVGKVERGGKEGSVLNQSKLHFLIFHYLIFYNTR